MGKISELWVSTWLLHGASHGRTTILGVWRDRRGTGSPALQGKPGKQSGELRTLCGFGGGKAGLLSSCTLHRVEMCPNCKAAYHKDLAHKKITMPKAHCRENATSLWWRPRVSETSAVPGCYQPLQVGGEWKDSGCILPGALAWVALAAWPPILVLLVIQLFLK